MSKEGKASRWSGKVEVSNSASETKKEEKASWANEQPGAERRSDPSRGNVPDQNENAMNETDMRNEMIENNGMIEMKK